VPNLRAGLLYYYERIQRQNNKLIDCSVNNNAHEHWTWRYTPHVSKYYINTAILYRVRTRAFFFCLHYLVNGNSEINIRVFWHDNTLYYYNTVWIPKRKLPAQYLFSGCRVNTTTRHSFINDRASAKIRTPIHDIMPSHILVFKIFYFRFRYDSNRSSHLPMIHV